MPSTPDIQSPQNYSLNTTIVDNRRRSVRPVGKKRFLALVGTVMACVAPAAAEAKQFPDLNLDFLKPKHPLPEQWYAGTMIGYSPAFKKGEGGIEPMSNGIIPIGHYNSRGGLHKGASTKTFYQDEWFKQALTDRISVTIQPTWGITSAGKTASGGHMRNSKVQFEDLPVDFQYRLTSSYSPSLTVNMGFKAPTGQYNNLSNASQTLGSTGTFDLRYGAILQFIQPFFKHQMRFRIWGFGRTPVTSAKMKNISSYGSDQGFRGRAHVGSYGTEGVTAEFGLTRQWVLGLDLYSDWSSGTSFSGQYVRGPHKGNRMSRTGWSTDYNVGPALEYSYSANLSAAFEVVLTVAGHNTDRVISPQFGVYYAW